MKNHCKLSPLALGLSLGTFWGVSLLIMGLVAYFFTYGVEFVSTVNTLYLVYQPTIMGGIIGAIIGFINAFISGVIVAWLYNCFSCCHACHEKGKES